jgi:transposase
MVRIDRSVMIGVMKESKSISDMARRLGISTSPLRRLAKETVIDRSGITVYDVLMSLPRNQKSLKFKLDVNQILEASKDKMTLESLVKELGYSYKSFLNFAKNSINPQTGENLLSSLKHQIYVINGNGKKPGKPKESVEKFLNKPKNVEIQKLLGRGLRCSEIERIVDCSYSTITKVKKSLKTPTHIQ